MEIVKFGMKSTLIWFRDNYYQYNRAAGNNNVSDDDIGLAIEGYESAFLASIIVSYLFKMTDAHCSKAIVGEIYCDDGLVVFKGR
eukprot:3495582-Ditylum_brightwellii.AAC.1